MSLILNLNKLWYGSVCHFPFFNDSKNKIQLTKAFKKAIKSMPCICYLKRLFESYYDDGDDYIR